MPGRRTDAQRTGRTCNPGAETRMRHLLFVAAVAAALVSLPAASGASHTHSQSSELRELTSRGRLLWNLEGVLRRNFRNPNDVWMSRRHNPVINFACCSSRGAMAPYGYVFRPPGGGAFHLSSRRFAPGNFGVDPVQVLVRGRSVACDARERRFLIMYRGSAGVSLGCSLPPG